MHCAELPLEGLGKLEPVLTEVLFSQMMRLPCPHLKPIAYATILVISPPHGHMASLFMPIPAFHDAPALPPPGNPSTTPPSW